MTRRSCGEGPLAFVKNSPLCDCLSRGLPCNNVEIEVLSMPEKYLITHDGTFHADEVFSAAVLTFLFPDATLLRSRKPEVLAMEGDVIMFDVGGIFDPAHGRFDHHQLDAPVRDDGSNMSAFGQIWDHFGEAYLKEMAVSQEHWQAIFEAIRDRIVRPIDLSDTGDLAPGDFGPMASLSLPTMINDMNLPSSAKPYAQDRAFNRAVSLAGSFLEGRIAQLEMKLEMRSLIMEAVLKCDGPILWLPEGGPFNRVIREAEADHIQFVAYPRGSDWVLNGVRPDPQSYDLRLPLPQSWAGLVDEDLARETGVPDARFCHRALFMAVAGSRAGITALAEAALEQLPLHHPESSV